MQSLSKPELLALLAAAKAYRQRDWLMILVAFNHGLRASEVVNLQANSIESGHLTVQRLKGSMRTVQPLLSHADPLLDEQAGLIEHTRGMLANQRLFPITRGQFWRIVQRYAKAAGLPKHKAHPHALKHSVAMQTIGTAGIENTRQWLGHRSISSTGEYLRVSDEAAGEAVKKALGI